MRKLSVGQKKISAEILGNIAVAWMAAGVIAPLFSEKFIILEFIPKFLISLSLSALFSAKSLDLVKRIRT